MRRCEDEKMFYRPPLLEEPCAQTLSGKKDQLTISKGITLKKQQKIVFAFLYLETSVRPERGLSAHNKRSGGIQGYWHCRPKVIIDSIGRK